MKTEVTIYHTLVERRIELQNMNAIHLSSRDECLELLKSIPGEWIDNDRNYYKTKDVIYRITKIPSNMDKPYKNTPHVTVSRHPDLYRITVYELQQP
jgi:hypothetical protein